MLVKIWKLTGVGWESKLCLWLGNLTGVAEKLGCTGVTWELTSVAWEARLHWCNVGTN